MLGIQTSLIKIWKERPGIFDLSEYVEERTAKTLLQVGLPEHFKMVEGIFLIELRRFMNQLRNNKTISA